MASTVVIFFLTSTLPSPSSICKTGPNDASWNRTFQPILADDAVVEFLTMHFCARMLFAAGEEGTDRIRWFDPDFAFKTRFYLTGFQLDIKKRSHGQNENGTRITLRDDGRRPAREESFRISCKMILPPKPGNFGKVDIIPCGAVWPSEAILSGFLRFCRCGHLPASRSITIFFTWTQSPARRR